MPNIKESGPESKSLSDIIDNIFLFDQSKKEGKLDVRIIIKKVEEFLARKRKEEKDIIYFIFVPDKKGEY